MAVGWQRVETLGLAEVVMAILRARLTVPWANAAAVARHPRGGGFVIQVRLYDAGAAPAAGGSAHPDGTGAPGEVVATFVAGLLGEDLAQAFGARDVIILK